MFLLNWGIGGVHLYFWLRRSEGSVRLISSACGHVSGSLHLFLCDISMGAGGLQHVISQSVATLKYWGEWLIRWLRRGRRRTVAGVIIRAVSHSVQDLSLTDLSKTVSSVNPVDRTATVHRLLIPRSTRRSALSSASARLEILSVEGSIVFKFGI